MVRTFIFGLLLVLLGSCSNVEESPNHSAPATIEDSEPLLVIIEYDPWRNVIGSDSPSYALYKDRRVIFRTENTYKSARLSNYEYAELIERLDVKSRLSTLDESYTLQNATDQVTTLILSYSSEEVEFVSAYGSLRYEAARERAPAELLSLFDIAAKHIPQDSQIWLPEKVEVMIWPYAYAPEESIQWPRDWPGLDDPNTVQRGDSYSIFLPSHDFEELKELLKQRKTKGAIEIDGQKWAASFRFPFPAEERWMNSTRQE